MKVHTLSIDSSQHSILTIASNSYYDNGSLVIDGYSNIHQTPNNYVVRLENPIYDVSSIKLVSARIPIPQLLVNASNKTFSVDGVDITLDETNYSNGTDLASDIDLKLQPPTSNVDSVVFDTDTNSIIFSNTFNQDFTFEFHTGTNGYWDTSSSLTNPHQIMGFNSNNYSSTNGTLYGGAINLSGPNSLVLRLTAGSDEFNQLVYSGTPFYTGHILINGASVINYSHADDPLTHQFYTGTQKYIRDVRIEFFYMSHGRLIPYDFRNQDHVLKFEIECSTDKLEGLPKVSPDAIKDEEDEIQPPVSIPVNENPYNWEVVIGIFFVMIMLLLLLRRRPKSIE